MMLKAYSIFDNKALQYHPPYFQSTHGAATRMFADLANDTNTNIGRHPGDFSLFCIGGYDDAKGMMMPVQPIEHVVDAVALIQRAVPLFDDLSDAQEDPMAGSSTFAR